MVLVFLMVCLVWDGDRDILGCWGKVYGRGDGRDPEKAKAPAHLVSQCNISQTQAGLEARGMVPLERQERTFSA